MRVASGLRRRDAISERQKRASFNPSAAIPTRAAGTLLGRAGYRTVMGIDSANGIPTRSKVVIAVAVAVEFALLSCAISASELQCSFFASNAVGDDDPSLVRLPTDYCRFFFGHLWSIRFTDGARPMNCR